MVLDLFRSRTSLEAEVVALRQQLNVLRRSAPKRPALSRLDRLIFVWLYRLLPNVLDAGTIVRPETIFPRARAGFRAYWRCSRKQEESADLRCPSKFGTDPGHERDQPALGCSPHSWRAP